MLLDNNNINNEFVDQSWEEMRGQLDREMPVQKKDRSKFIFLFFFASFFFAAGLLTQAYLIEKPIQNNISNDKVQNVVQQQLPIAEVPKQEDISSSAILANNFEPLVSNKVLSPSTNANPAIKKTAVNSNHISKDSKYDIQIGIIKKEETAPRNINQIGNNLAKVFERKIDVNKNVNTLPILDLAKLNFSRSKVNMNSTVSLFNNQRFFDRFNIAFGPEMVSTGNFDFIGYGGMINMSFNLTPRISLNAGASLNKFDRLKKVVNYDAVTFIAPVSPEYQVLNQKLTTHYDNLNRFVDLSIPVGLEYKAHKYLSLSAGIVFRSSIYKEVQGYPLHIQSSVNRIDKNYSNSFVNPFLGIGINLTQDFGLNLNYEHGTKSIINTDLYPNSSQKLSIVKLSLSFKLL